LLQWFLYNLLDFGGLYFFLVLVSLYLFLAFVGYRAPLLLYLVCDLSNPDFKQDFDYEKYDLSHVQNAIIE
jgi:hypothetical protein